MRIKVFTLAALIILLGVLNGTSAQTRPLWNDLKPGSYAVGLKVLWKRDYSRTWQNENDYEGRKRPVEAARPVRITVWYPARKPLSAYPMNYSEYTHFKVADPSFADFNRRVEESDLGGDGKGVRGLFKSQVQFDRLMKTRASAFLDAPPMVGSFPLIIYSLGQGDYTQENVVLWEYLASHGYIVATIPQLGTSPRRFQLFIHDPPSYEAQVRDLEYVMEVMHDFPNVNVDKTAAMGMSTGGVYALLLAMRNSKINAVVGLDPSFIGGQPSYAYKYWEAPYYDIARLKGPLMVLYRGTDDSERKWDLVDSLRYSDRYLFKFSNLVHADFTSYPMLTLNAPREELDPYALKYRTQETAARGFQAVCRYALSFLDAYLKGDEPALRFIKDQPEDQGVAGGIVEREFKAGLKVPTEEEFYTIIQEHGLDAAMRVYRAAKAKYPQENIIRDTVIRRIGNEMTFLSEPSKAVEVFKLYVEAYPRSDDAYERLGEGYRLIGDKELAVHNFKKSLELNPQNQNAIERLKELMK
jgi:dienelactone hydrolase